MVRLFPIRPAVTPALFSLCSLLLSACEPFEKSVAPFEKTDTLIVIAISHAMTEEDMPDTASRLERDLVTEFAREANMTVRIKPVQTPEQAILLLEKNQAHFVTGLDRTAKHQSRVSFGPVYQNSYLQVAYNTRRTRPRNTQDLTGKTVETAMSPGYTGWLDEIGQQYPELKWTESGDTDHAVLARLAAGETDFAIADSIQIDLEKNFHTNVDAAFNLGEPAGKAWALAHTPDPVLQARIAQFFRRIAQDGTLFRLLDRHYGHLRRVDQVDIPGILKKMQTLLPPLRKHFHQAEEITGIDWRLIAALAYQESHWDRLATSPTNVRGLMMLTEETADRMKVTDRLDARQSILAGARYLLILKDKLPPRILEPDRTWIALASYNQGYGHIEDARILAQRKRLSPDLWVNIKQTLPLLSLDEYIATAKHGYVRGGEAVVLTESVRTYYNILLRYEQPYLWHFGLASAAPQPAVQAEPVSGQ